MAQFPVVNSDTDAFIRKSVNVNWEKLDLYNNAARKILRFEFEGHLWYLKVTFPFGYPMVKFLGNSYQKMDLRFVDLNCSVPLSFYTSFFNTGSP